MPNKDNRSKFNETENTKKGNPALIETTIKQVTQHRRDTISRQNFISVTVSMLNNNEVRRQDIKNLKLWMQLNSY